MLSLARKTDQQRADDAADQVHADHVERVVVAEPRLQPDRADGQIAPAIRPTKIAPIGRDRTAGRGDGDQSGDGARRRADAGDVAVLDLLDGEPGQRRRAGGDERGDHDDRGRVARGQRRTAVERVPAGPQQAGAEQRQRNVVRLTELAAAQRTCPARSRRPVRQRRR